MNPRDSVELMETQPGTLKGELVKDVPGKGKEVEGEEGEEDDKTPDSFDCSVCGRGFPFLSSLSQHMRRHTGARPYKCPYCDHRASQKGNLKVHIRSHKLGTLTSHHPEEDEEGAEEEEEASQAEVGVPEGLDGGTSPTKSSSACNRVVNGEAGAAEEGRRKVAVRSVKREKAGAEPRPYCCRLCGYEALREDQLLSHIEKAHITADGDEEAAPAAREEEAEAEAPRSDGSYPCETCGQVFTQAWFLKSHMKKHAGLLEHCCRVCGRRFREAWFLKSHMKTHTSSKSKSRPKVDSTEPPVTINDVAQDPEAVALSLYQICSKCGNMFHSRESLRAHEKVHGQSCGRRPHGQPADHEDSPAAKRLLLDYLNLRPAEEEPQEEQERAVEEHESKVRVGFRIPELDPVCSYQAWQLATRGRVVEPVEPSVKGSSGAVVGEEALAGAAVVFEKESSRYVLKGQEKRGAARRTGSHSSAGERTPESLSDSEYRPSSRQERRRPSQTSSKANECFECGKVFRSRHQMIVHQRVHRRDGGRGSGGERERPARGERWGSTSDPDSGSPSRPSTPGYGDSPPDSSQGEQASEMGKANSGNPADEKPYLCSLCDFVSAESSAFLTHVRLQHTAERDGRPGSTPSPSPSSERGTPSSYPKLKRALLHGAAPHPYLAARPKRPTQPTSPPDPSLDALDLCVRAEGHRGLASEAVDKNGLPSHKCSFCSHSTCYPEVLWMHQTVAHRINSGSSPLAPKWALKNGLTKGPKDSHSKRRTGPPPALDGKACPPLPSLVRTPRTRPPLSANEAQKKSRAAGHPGTSSASSSSTTPSSRGSTSTSGPQATRPPPRSGGSSSSRPKGDIVKENQGLPSRSRPKTEKYPQGGSASSFPHGSLEKSSGAPQRPAVPSPGLAAAARLADRYALPQEGLGFMLSSKHGLAEYSRARSSPQASQPKSSSPHSHGSSHGQGRMSRANRPSPMAHSAAVGQGYGTSQAHGGGHHSSGSSSSSTSSSSSVKQESQAETAEIPVDILSFLKNYNPHELAALYHRWGSANPLLDPTGMLRALMRQGEYVCHECGKSFSQPSHLRTHMRSHTGERPFRCHLCPYRASQKGNLKTHVQSVHHVPFDNEQYRHARPSPPDRSPGPRPPSSRRPRSDCTHPRLHSPQRPPPDPAVKTERADSV